MKKLSLDTLQCVICVSKIDTTTNNLTLTYLFNFYYGRSVARCPEPHDRIIAIVNKNRVRDQEEKNKIFTIY